MRLTSRSLSFLILVGVATASPPSAPDSTGALLPAGFLGAGGSQIVDSFGTPVRIRPAE